MCLLSENLQNQKIQRKEIKINYNSDIVNHTGIYPFVSFTELSHSD
jgi:hypothetical protein